MSVELGALVVIVPAVPGDTPFREGETGRVVEVSYTGRAGRVEFRDGALKWFEEERMKTAPGEPGPSVIVSGVWAKRLEVGDRIVSFEMVDSRYGPIRRFTVARRTSRAMRAEAEALLAAAAARDAAEALDVEPPSDNG